MLFLPLAPWKELKYLPIKPQNELFSKINQFTFMRHYLFLSLLMLTLGLWSCGNAPQESSDQEEGMEQFAKDESFKEKHETPEDINYTGAGKQMEFDTPDGQKGTAYAILPEGETDKFLFVIHEWWGLNDQVKQEADRLFEELDNVAVMALDLYDGKVTDDQNKAGEYMTAASKNIPRLENIVKGAMSYAGSDAKIATIGWCFGGGWSLRSSILAGDQGAGCVIYYGMPVQDQEALAPYKGDILGIFADKDAWITPEVASNLKKLAEANGNKVDIHQYDADHAFANPSSPRYNEAAAQEANKLALSFLKSHL